MPSTVAPVSLVSFAGSALEPVDLLGRQKINALALTPQSPASAVRKAAASAFATIEANNFKFKSLSSWAYNIAIGCRHGCRFCYVPDTQHTAPGKTKLNTGSLASALRAYGVTDPDADWGKYVLFRPWDEAKFLASLARAEKTPVAQLNPDGNRAIMLCSTTDPYQTISIPGNPAKQKLLQQQCRFLVRRALELILERSTLNVRILTRSPLAREDFDLYRKFGNRLLFGMSLPTLDDRLTSIYEPHAPGPKKRLETLQKAREAGLNVFVAVAPTYPECHAADLRATLKAIRPLKPVTIFHEPINIRAENVARIATHAAGLRPPVALRTEVFATPTSWRRYAVEQLMAMQEVATKLGMQDRLHLWPDKNLRTKAVFLEASRERFAQANPGYRATTHETLQRGAEDESAYQEFERWLSHWHSRISEWPGV